MQPKRVHILINIIISIIWLLNGLYCKVLNYVPRHREIVSKILGLDLSATVIITTLIGIAEILMAFWILSRIRGRLNALVQISIIAIMNILEFILAPDLLLWGRFNILFAFLFLFLIYYNEFVIRNKYAHD